MPSMRVTIVASLVATRVGRAGVMSAAAPSVLCCELRAAGGLPQQAHGGVQRDQQGVETWRKGHHVHVQQVMQAPFEQTK